MPRLQGGERKHKAHGRSRVPNIHLLRGAERPAILLRVRGFPLPQAGTLRRQGSNTASQHQGLQPRAVAKAWAGEVAADGTAALEPVFQG